MYHAAENRYESMHYRRCGRSGLKLSAISLGLWHNFGDGSPQDVAEKMLCTAFDLGITHFDLANNYGPPPGSAERNFGSIFARELAAYRDEIIISSKAGYDMWPGPYGNHGSRKYIIASCEQSLQRMKLEYVDIFYHHRPDPETPLEESMAALDYLVRSGKAIYAGVSNYNPEQTQAAAAILKQLGTPCLIHQPCYSMVRREPENGLFDRLANEGVGAIAFSPLAQGLLTNKYLTDIPDDSRAGRGRLRPEHLSAERLHMARQLNEIAAARGQNLAQMSLAWVLRQPVMTSVLIGASRPEQIHDAVGCLTKLSFEPDELANIDAILSA